MSDAQQPDVALRGALAAASRHRQRIREALAHLDAATLPDSAAAMLAVPYATLASAELLLSRFAKLQDLLGAKVFRLVLALTAEPIAPTATFIDVLHHLERLGALPSAAGWRRLRELRNTLAHDYPDDPEAAAAALQAVVRAVPELLTVLAAVERHVERAEGRVSGEADEV